MQPQYYNLNAKIQARKKNASIWRSLVNKHSIPEDGQYWTLANIQPPNNKGTEIIQMMDIGIITSYAQFFGVDWDADIISKNKEWHPEANWICGYWNDAIRSVDNFNPSFIYLDLTSFVCSDSVLNIIDSTMHLCPNETVMFINVMLNSPRGKEIFDNQYIINNLPKKVPPSEMKKWSQSVSSFIYNASGKTEMQTFVMFKKEE